MNRDTPFWANDPAPWALNVPCRDFAPAAQSDYRVWPDGTVQATEDGEPYSWMSDDFAVIRAGSPEEADRRVNGTPPPLPPAA